MVGHCDGIATGATTAADAGDDLIERPSISLKRSGLAREVLPELDDDAGILGIEFHQPSASALLIAGDQGRARAAEKIDHQGAAR